VAAIKSEKTWRKANTSVTWDEHGFFNVRLHGNLIARGELFGRDDGAVTMHSCGWKTATTKSRINAVLTAIGSKDRIYQHKGQWMHWMDRYGTSMPFIENGHGM
jgi:hypothetical protein